MRDAHKRSGVDREEVDVAVRAGVDAVKFQTFNPDTLITKTAAVASTINIIMR